MNHVEFLCAPKERFFHGKRLANVESKRLAGGTQLTARRHYFLYSANWKVKRIKIVSAEWGREGKSRKKMSEKCGKIQD